MRVSSEGGTWAKIGDAFVFGALFGAFTAVTWGPALLIFGTDLSWWKVILADIAVFAGVTLLLVPLGLLVMFVGDDSPVEITRRERRERRQWRAPGRPNEHRLVAAPTWAALAEAAYTRVKRRGVTLVVFIPLALAAGWWISFLLWFGIDEAFRIDASGPVRIVSGVLFALVTAAALLGTISETVGHPPAIVVGTVRKKERAEAKATGIVRLIGVMPPATVWIRTRNGFTVQPDGRRVDIRELRRTDRSFGCGLKTYNRLHRGERVALVCTGGNMAVLTRLQDLGPGDGD